MLHKVLLKKHTHTEHDGEFMYFAAGEHLVSPDIARKLTTQENGGVLLEKHDPEKGTVETEKPAVVEALIEGETPNLPKPTAKK